MYLANLPHTTHTLSLVIKPVSLVNFNRFVVVPIFIPNETVVVCTWLRLYGFDPLMMYKYFGSRVVVRDLSSSRWPVSGYSKPEINSTYGLCLRGWLRMV